MEGNALTKTACVMKTNRESQLPEWLPGLLFCLNGNIIIEIGATILEPGIPQSLEETKRTL